MVSIIEDEQPIMLGFQPVLHCLYCLVQVLRLQLWQAEKLRHLDKTCAEFSLCLSPYPEHSFVIVAVVIGILHGGLGLANPTQSANRLYLRQGCRTIPRQCLAEGLQDMLAPGVEGIALVRDVPERGKRESPCWRH